MEGVKKTVRRRKKKKKAKRVHIDLSYEKGYRKISYHIKISGNTVAVVIRRYRRSHHSTNQSCSGRPPEMTPQTVNYVDNRYLKSYRQGQVLSMEIQQRVTKSISKRCSLINVLMWWNETKTNLFCSDGVQHVWCEPDQDHHSGCIVLTVRHGGGSIMIWSCMKTKGLCSNLGRSKGEGWEEKMSLT
uniref:Uncharacterized protein n=1 Tax=Stegastes partitus TaxID=144197 RepID=A0A3B4ZNW6_9TELE